MYLFSIVFACAAGSPASPHDGASWLVEGPGSDDAIGYQMDVSPDGSHLYLRSAHLDQGLVAPLPLDLSMEDPLELSARITLPEQGSVAWAGDPSGDAVPDLWSWDFVAEDVSLLSGPWTRAREQDVLVGTTALTPEMGNYALLDSDERGQFVAMTASEELILGLIGPRGDFSIFDRADLGVGLLLYQYAAEVDGAWSLAVQGFDDIRVYDNPTHEGIIEPDGVVDMPEVKEILKYTDLTGDGVPDLLFRSYTDTLSNRWMLRTYFVEGPIRGTLTSEDARWLSHLDELIRFPLSDPLPWYVDLPDRGPSAALSFAIERSGDQTNLVAHLWEDLLDLDSSRVVLDIQLQFTPPVAVFDGDGDGTVEIVVADHSYCSTSCEGDIGEQPRPGAIVGYSID